MFKKIYNWFYDREYQHLIAEVYSFGLDVVDEPTWKKVVKKKTNARIIKMIIYLTLGIIILILTIKGALW